MEDKIKLTTEQFKGLKNGDRVYYSAASGIHHAEAIVLVAGMPFVSVTVKVEEVVIPGDNEDIKVGNIIYAAQSELFLF